MNHRLSHDMKADFSNGTIHQRANRRLAAKRFGRTAVGINHPFHTLFKWKSILTHDEKKLSQFSSQSQSPFTLKKTFFCLTHLVQLLIF